MKHVLSFTFFFVNKVIISIAVLILVIIEFLNYIRPPNAMSHTPLVSKRTTNFFLIFFQKELILFIFLIFYVTYLMSQRLKDIFDIFLNQNYKIKKSFLFVKIHAESNQINLFEMKEVFSMDAPLESLTTGYEFLEPSPHFTTENMKFFSSSIVFFFSNVYIVISLRHLSSLEFSKLHFRYEEILSCIYEPVS